MSNMKLGRRPAKEDERNIKLSLVLRTLPPIPDVFDTDDNLIPSPPMKIFANDKWGDCVIASRAEHTLRFESFEQKKILPITDNEVLDEYWSEQGATQITKKRFCKTVTTWSSKPDNGLVMLDSLKLWRNKGWISGDQYYNIYAFASVDFKNAADVKAAIFALSGVQIGIYVPQSALDQFEKGVTWEVIENSPVVGGHAVYGCGYNNTGPKIITWGKKVQTTWEFAFKYIEEMYAIVDNQDIWLGSDSPVDTVKLDAYLKEITS